MERIVALVDMDCFYVAVEQRSNPELKGKPCAVVQYKGWRGGGIIAVGYEARDFGVTRNMRGDDAKEKCPHIQLVRVPVVREKADLTKYREASAEVIEVFMEFADAVERASIDEAYIDLTNVVARKMAEEERVTPEMLANTFVIGYGPDKCKNSQTAKTAAADPTLRGEGVNTWLSGIYETNTDDIDEDTLYNARRLALGAKIIEEMRAAIYEKTGFRCSAGIAHNKMLAKLAAGLHKPNGQTVLPHPSVHGLFTTLPIQKVRHFGGKLGSAIMEKLQVENMADVCQFTERYLQDRFGDKTGSWLFNSCRGFDYEVVSSRQLAKSIGCSKNFKGKECLDTKEKVKFWLGQLCEEVVERLVKDRESNKRVSKNLVVSISSKENRGSRTCGIARYDAKKFAEDTYLLLSKFNLSGANTSFWNPPATNLTVSATKFVPLDETAPRISTFMTQGASQHPTPSNNQDKKTSRKGLIEGFLSKMASVNNTSLINNDLDDKPNGTKNVKGDAKADQREQRTSEINEGKSSFFQRYMQRKTGKDDMDNDSETDDGNNLRCLQELDETGNDDETVDGDTGLNGAENTEMLQSEDSNESAGVSRDVNVVQPSTSGLHAQEHQIALEGSSTREVNPMDGEDSNSQEGFQCTPSDYVLCDKCNKNIVVWEFPEHEDFHFALDLQEESKKLLPLGGTLSANENKSQKRKSSVVHGKGRPTKRTSLGNSKSVQKLDRFFMKN